VIFAIHDISLPYEPLAMGLGLRVKREVFLTKADSATLERAAKIKQRSQSSIIREALVEWLTAKGYLREEQEAPTPKKESVPPRRPTLGELLESERRKRVPGNER
jgi:hypothetical protein